MLEVSRTRIEQQLSENDAVLDVGGWANTWPRADWVLDLMPYETRGLYGEREPGAERFTADTWVQADICDRRPWPFADKAFDFSVCSHTLEDVRDPVWVCHELMRVSRAGYVEVPSRMEEQSFGVHGPWVGWSHHRWLIDVGTDGITFVHKPHLLGARPEFHFPLGFHDGLSAEQRVQALFWHTEFHCEEQIFLEATKHDEYLASFVAAHNGPAARARRPLSRRVAGGIRRLRRPG